MALDEKIKRRKLLGRSFTSFKVWDVVHIERFVRGQFANSQLLFKSCFTRSEVINPKNPMSRTPFIFFSHKLTKEM